MRSYTPIDRVAIHNIFGTGKDIYWYGILISIGVIGALIFAINDTKKRKLYSDLPFDMALVAVLCGLICARLYYVIFDTSGTFRKDPLSIFAVWNGGLAIYGGIIGGALGLFIYSRVKKLNLPTLFDITVPGLALGQAIGRWGNFINQEAFGQPVTDSAWQWFPFAVYINDPRSGYSAGWYNATFFYESMWCLLIFLFLFFYRKRQKFAGELTLLYIALYSFERMFVELLRSDQLLVGGMPVSHLLSVVLFAISVVLLAICYKKWRTGKLSPATPGSIYFVAKEELQAETAAEITADNITDNAAKASDAENKSVDTVANSDADDTEL